MAYAVYLQELIIFINLQLYMWDDYHVFSTLVFNRLLLDEICDLIELPFDWLIDDAMFVLFTWWFDSIFFDTAISHGKPVDLVDLCYKQND